MNQKLKKKRKIAGSIALILLTAILIAFSFSKEPFNDGILSYKVDLKTQNPDFYWKCDKNEILKSIANLKSYVESKNKKLLFAMNGGMYKSDNSPQGLFVQNNKIITPIDNSKGNGNFYLKPNGIFYTTNKNDAFVCETSQFKYNDNIKFATQSGPMLVLNGEIHTAFKKGSSNVHIRNGVGILPNNHIFFAMSKKEINFYDFAQFFKNAGCKNALYLDGFVSRTYLPEKNWVQTDGNFGVIIGVTK